MEGKLSAVFNFDVKLKNINWDLKLMFKVEDMSHYLSKFKPCLYLELFSQGLSGTRVMQKT